MTVDLYRKCPSCEGTRTVWDDPDSEYPEEYPCSACSDGYVLVSPQPSPDRAALVERMRKEITGYGGCIGEHDARVIMDRALAAVEAAGWGPRPEPIMEEERSKLAQDLAWLERDHPDLFTSDETVSAVLDCLPERHRRIVLGVSGE